MRTKLNVAVENEPSGECYAPVRTFEEVGFPPNVLAACACVPRHRVFCAAAPHPRRDTGDSSSRRPSRRSAGPSSCWVRSPG